VGNCLKAVRPIFGELQVKGEDSRLNDDRAASVALMSPQSRHFFVTQPSDVVVMRMLFAGVWDNAAAASNRCGQCAYSSAARI
jgi:hypothetical protein